MDLIAASVAVDALVSRSHFVVLDRVTFVGVSFFYWLELLVLW